MPKSAPGTPPMPAPDAGPSWTHRPHQVLTMRAGPRPGANDAPESTPPAFGGRPEKQARPHRPPARHGHTARPAAKGAASGVARNRRCPAAAHLK